MPLENDITWLGEASRRSRWLVGVSGGADSTALLHLLNNAGFRNLVVCHLDHRLRGRASTGDAAFVRKLAASLDLDSEIGRCDVKERMKKDGGSMETVARKARLEFFAACAVKHRCHQVLLAHHADDQAETVLWNLLRGSRGLKGMKEEQVIRVESKRLVLIRPLLGIRHAALVDWLAGRGLAWREDASNVEPVGVRNRLRNEVFPLLADISGRDAVVAFVMAAADWAESEEMEMSALAAVNLLDPQGRLHLPALRELSPALQRAALRKFLLDHGVDSIGRKLLQEALGLLDAGHSPSVNLPGGRQLRRRAGRITITEPEVSRPRARSVRSCSEDVPPGGPARPR